MGRENRDITTEKALEKLQTLCARAEKSSSDAVRLMYKWGVSKDEMSDVVEKLRRDKYIDDRRYVEAYTRDKAKFSSWGSKKIIDTLIMRGLDGDLVREIVREQISNKEMKVKLETLLRKKYLEVKQKEDNMFKIKDKLFRYAASHGYSFDDIASIIDQM